jgi:hypothetical protein
LKYGPSAQRLDHLQAFGAPGRLRQRDSAFGGCDGAGGPTLGGQSVRDVEQHADRRSRVDGGDAGDQGLVGGGAFQRHGVSPLQGGGRLAQGHRRGLCGPGGERQTPRQYSDQKPLHQPAPPSPF